MTYLDSGLMRASSIGRRWIRQLFLTANVAIAVYCVSKVYLNFERIQNIVFWNENKFLYVLIFYISGILFSVFLERSYALGRRHSVHLTLRSPPVWIGIFALIPIQLSASIFYHDVYPKFSWAGIIASFSFFIGVSIREFSYGICRHKNEENAFKALGYDDEGAALYEDPELRWIFTEGPITSDDEDYFDFGPRVSRVENMLRRNPGCSVAVLGRFGVGKSSFINLVEKKLSCKSVCGRDQWILVRIEGWGLEKGAAAERILEESISELSLYLDLSSVATISQSYRLSIGAKRFPVIDSILSMFWGRHNVIDEFIRLNDILYSGGLRILIVLEDMDRNVESSIVRQEIPALIEKLKRYSQIGFILAMGSENISFEILSRVCDHQEILG